MSRILRIGTRDSQLALWQANLVKDLLATAGREAELVLIKSEGDIDTVTPLYELGVQGVFTKALDAAMLSGRIDLAVHSMKDVPTQLARGIVQAAVLERASVKDIFVYKRKEDIEAIGYAGGEWKQPLSIPAYTIATGSVRRIAQWLNRFPGHKIENLRGNVNTRLRKLEESSWQGAIFAAAGLERINLRPENSIDLDWMLPAPAQGAIMVVCREEDADAAEACTSFNHPTTALCTKIERDFLRTLMGGCSTPISGYARMVDDKIVFSGNVVSPDGSKKAEIEKSAPSANALQLGMEAGKEILENEGNEIIQLIRKKASGN